MTVTGYCMLCQSDTTGDDGKCPACSAPVFVKGSPAHRVAIVQQGRFKLLSLLVDIRGHIGRDNLVNVIGPELHARFVELVGDGVQ